MLGLKFERNRMEGVVLHRSSNGLKVQRSFQSALSLDPLKDEPELVGREIRNQLNEADVRERRCVVCVPLNWALTLHVNVPEMADEDVASFLEIESERGFPYAPEDLLISYSLYHTPSGEQHATVVAIPKNHMALLESVLSAGQLKPVSFSLAISALQEPNKVSDEGVVALLLGENTLELQISSGNGVVALRSFEHAYSREGNEKRVDADLIARELKITLGQLPRDVGRTVRKLRLFGRKELTGPLLQDIQTRVGGMGLEVETEVTGQVNGFQLPLPLDQCVLPQLGMAARYMGGHAPGFEFLPPKVSPLSQLLARFSSRKLVSTGAVSGAVVFLILVAFVFQQWKLSSLQSQWQVIEPSVTEVDALQQQIRAFRPWFDQSHLTLRIIHGLTGAFPEDGGVTAKTLSVGDLSVVSVSGIARDNQALLKLKDRLLAMNQISDLMTDRQQGESPLQFSIRFRWMDDGGTND